MTPATAASTPARTTPATTGPQVSPAALRRWMAARHLSPDGLARRAGIARSTVSAALDGRYRVGPRAVLRIALALGVEPGDLT